MRTSGIVLDVARQVGGAMPSVVTLYDRSRWKNNGAMTNVTWTQLPRELWVMNFNGASSLVNCGAAASFNITAITIEIWVKVGVVGVPNFILGKDFAAGVAPYIMDVPATNFPTFRFWDTGWRTVSGTSALTTAKWYHILATYDKSLPSANMKIFNNGAQQATTNYTGSLPTNAAAFKIGYYNGNYFNGVLSKVRIYNYPLSATTIYKKFQAERRYFGV